MTQHMFDLVREMLAPVGGPVLEIGSYVESQQDHLNMRNAFPADTHYIGIDANPGAGVDFVVDLLSPTEMDVLQRAFTPRVVLCLYVVEHAWRIHDAMRALADVWKRNPESWMLVATHQNQPYHGTAKYGDYWRLTLQGLRQLAIEAGFPSPAHVLGHRDTSNPDDIILIRQPQSMPHPWPNGRVGTAVQWSPLP